MKRLLVIVTLCLIILPTFTSPQTISAKPLTSYPSDPTSDIAWSAGTNGVTDIQTAFNYARTIENAQLGKSIPSLTMPSQATWDTMSDSQKAFWLINRERIDRGVTPMDNVETNVTSIAQYYANYLITGLSLELAA